MISWIGRCGTTRDDSSKYGNAFAPGLFVFILEASGDFLARQDMAAAAVSDDFVTAACPSGDGGVEATVSRFGSLMFLWFPKCTVAA